MSASTCLHVSRRRDESVLKACVKDITDARVHCGYLRAHVMLRREGHVDNVKRVYRLYREEGLSPRTKRPKRNRAAQLRQPKRLANAIHEIWSMDCVADALFGGRKFRLVPVVDLFTREGPAIEVGQSLEGEDVVRVLTGTSVEGALAWTIKSDNANVESFNADCARSVSMPVASCLWRTQRKRPRLCASTTTRAVPTLRKTGPRPLTTPAIAGNSPQR